MTLSENLKRIRTSKRLSQRELAQLAGVSQQSISRLENGDDQTSKYLSKIATALEVSIHEIDENYATSVDEALSEICTLWEKLNPGQKTNILTTVRIFAEQSSLR